MSDSEKIRARTNWWKSYAWVLAVVWTVVIGASLVYNVVQVRHNTLEAMRHHARAAFEKDLIWRRWITSHGGVYIPVSENTQPNPYLSHIEERDITTPSGRRLTLFNPAYVTRQVHELGDKQYSIRGHITSLTPIRPENAADLWEQGALESFEQGITEVSSVEKLNGQNHIRLMRPLVTEKGCLKCHAAQGYKVGDIRGGISISIPMKPVLAIVYRHTIGLVLSHGLLWILGLGGIGLGARGLSRRIRERNRSEEALRASNRFLEIANRHTEMFPLLREFVVEVQKLCACAAVGIRLLDEEGNIPYEDYVGFSQNFYESESPLSIKSDKCMCINVIKGDADPTLPFYTEGGSFYMNGTTKFLSNVTEEEKGQTRNVCNETGYESVALVPIRYRECILGLIHLADPKENMVPLDIIEILEGVGMQLGTAMRRILTEEALRESEEKLRNIIDSLPMGVHMYQLEADGQLHFIGANPAADKILGVDNTKYIGKTINEAFPKIAETEIPERFRKIAEKGGFWERHNIVYGDEVIAGVFENYNFQTSPGKMVSLFMDVTERKKAEEEIRRKNEMLEAFFYMVSHDLKNPVISLQGFCSLLLKNYRKGLNEKAIFYVDRISANAELIAGMLEDMLELAQIGSLKEERAEISIQKVIELVWVNLSSSFGTEDVELTMSESLPNILCYEKRLYQIFDNLLSNAVKFKSETRAARVEIGYEDNGDHYKFFVRDNGIGIEQRYHDKIFDVFSKLEGSKSGGTGVGLAVVKRIVESNHGRVWVESRVGVGSTFYFTIPKKL